MTLTLSRRHFGAGIRELGTACLLLALMAILAGCNGGGNAQSSGGSGDQEVQFGDTPVTFAEIEAARTTWAEEENGGKLFEPLIKPLYNIYAFRPYTSSPFVVEGVDEPPLGQKWIQQHDDFSGQALDNLAEPLEQIDKLADYKGGRFNPSQETLESFGTEPHFEERILQTAKIKALESVYKAIHQETASLSTDLVVSFRLSSLLAEEPSLGWAMHADLCDQLAISALHHVLAHVTLTDEQLQQISEVLQERVNAENDRYYWGLVGERAAIIKSYNLEEDVQDKSLGGVSPEFANAMTVCNELIAEAKQPFELVQQAEQANTQYEEAIGSLTEYYREIGAGSLQENLQRHGLVVAGLRASLAGVAAERYRVANGSFPEQLDALVPTYLESVPTDPYSDKPLLYKQEDDKVVIYSVGENGQDDAGQTRYAQSTKDSPDVGFVLLSPDQRNRAAE